MARKYTKRRGKNYGSAKYGRSGVSARIGRGKNSIGLKITPAFGLGVLLAVTDVDKKIPGDAILAGSSMPVSGNLAGPVKAVSQGMVMGNLAQKRFGVSLPLFGGSESSSSFNGI